MQTLWILIGRLHPVLVHFPIALMTVGAGLRAWSALRPAGTETHRRAGGLLMLLGVLGGIIACVAGFAYAADGQFRGGALAAVEQHRNAAIIATLCGLVAVLVDRFRVGPAAGATAAALVAAGVVSYAGHLGGVSVYGADHYTVAPRAAEPADGTAPAPVAAVEPIVAPPPGMAIDFNRDVQPIFDSRCYRCHDARKRKGGLRLDRKKYFLEGGDGGAAVVAGKPMASKLFQMINLPVDHEDYMPAKGDPIPQAEVDVIGRWIEQGAVWPDDV